MFEFISLRPPSCEHKIDTVIILLHGLGATPEDLRGMVEMLEIPRRETTEFILPRAPRMALHLAQGQKVNAWFNLFELNINSVEDMVGIHRSITALDHLVTDIHQRGISPHRVFIGGFSQGGALALRYLFCCRLRLGGFVALSSYLPLRHTRPRIRVESAAPLFLFHGNNDTVLPFSFAQESYKILTQRGFDVTWVSSEAGHHLDATVLKKLSAWLAPKIQPDCK